MPQITTKPLPFFKLKPQVRTHFDEAEDRQLGESLRIEQQDDLFTQPDGTVIDGERRLRAAQLVGLESLRVRIADKQLSDGEVKVWQLVSAMQRANLSGYDKWIACCDLMTIHSGWQIKDLAERLSFDQSMGTRLHSPSKCIAEAQDALKAGKIGISDCYALSKIGDAEGQRGLLALKLSGASRDVLEQAGRRRRNGHKPAVHVSRVKCVVSGGIAVVVSGNGRSLDRYCEALAEACKDARKAISQGLNAKEFHSVNQRKAKVTR